MKLSRPAIFFSAIAAAVVAVVVFGALLLPRMVDSQAIRDRISAKLAKQFAGRLIIGKIELLWWPQPSMMIDDAEFSFDENNQASFQNLKIYPSIIDLLAARFIVRRALLEGPKGNGSPAGKLKARRLGRIRKTNQRRVASFL